MFHVPLLTHLYLQVADVTEAVGSLKYPRAL